MGIINTTNWKFFRLDELFDITGSTTTKIDDLELIGAGKYPYITTQATNNGVAGFFDFYTDKGNVLTIDSAVLGYCSYHSEDFSASDHVEKLIPKFKMTKNIALFIVTIINREQYRFNYGRKANQIQIANLKIKLPVTNEGTPDYHFMEEYIEGFKLNEIKTKINTMNTFNPNLLSKYFTIDEIFDRIEPAKGTTTDNLLPGNDVPYIAAKKDDNGLMEMVALEGNEEFISKGNCIVFVQLGQGSAGFTTYQNDDFIGMNGKISCAYSSKLNKYNALFLVTVLDRERPKYSFGRSWTGERLKATRIKLPVDSQGEINWKYMEDYIKSLPYADNI